MANPALSCDQVLNHQLQGTLAPKLIDVKPVSNLYFTHCIVGPLSRIDIKCDCIQQRRMTRGRQHHFQMLASDQTLTNDLKPTIENRFWKALSPGPGKAQLCRQLQLKILNRQLAVCFDNGLQFDIFRVTLFDAAASEVYGEVEYHLFAPGLVSEFGLKVWHVDSGSFLPGPVAPLKGNFPGWFAVRGPPGHIVVTHDEDECALGTDACEAPADGGICTNTDGGSRAACKSTDGNPFRL